MLAPRVIPCLDIDSGRVVKGVRFQNLRDAGDPVASATLYQEQGGDEIVLLDVSATPESRRSNLEVVAAIREHLSIPLTVGGGVRSVGDAARLLEAGSDKVGINTAAVDRPRLISEMARLFGSQCAVVAVDAARTGSGSWEVLTHSGAHRTGLDVIQWCRRASELGAGEILLTSWDRDGTGHGYDLALLEAASDAIEVPLIASGGANASSDLVEAFESGADAALVASVLHDGRATVEEIKLDLLAAGIGVRP